MNIYPLARIRSWSIISVLLNQHFHKLNIELINLCSYSYRGFEVFLKVPVIIISRFSENIECEHVYIHIYIYIYIYIYI